MENGTTIIPLLEKTKAPQGYSLTLQLVKLTKNLGDRLRGLRLMKI